MNTQDQLDDLTTTIGDALRKTWLKGYTTASAEILGQAIGEIEQRATGLEDNSGNADIIQGLSIAAAIVKGLLK